MLGILHCCVTLGYVRIGALELGTLSYMVTNIKVLIISNRQPSTIWHTMKFLLTKIRRVTIPSVDSYSGSRAANESSLFITGWNSASAPKTIGAYVSTIE